MNVDTWLGEMNVDTALVDAGENELNAITHRVLLLLSVGIDPNNGCAAAEELASAVNQLADDESTAKHRIAEMLSRPGNDYQRALWFTLAGRGVYGASGYLNDLVGMLQARRAAWNDARRNGNSPVKCSDPYVAPNGEGPRGQFDPDFELSPSDRSFIDTVKALEAAEAQRSSPFSG